MAKGHNMQVEFTFSQSDLLALTGPVPLAVQIRLKLGREGFSFTDDGRVSSIINENPVALGTLIIDESYIDGSVKYTQIITEH